MTKTRSALDPTVLCFIGALVISSPVFAATQSGLIEGRIRKFECGDNCYLTIVDTVGKEHVGLCTAPECTTWNR